MRAVEPGPRRLLHRRRPRGPLRLRLPRGQGPPPSPSPAPSPPPAAIFLTRGKRRLCLTLKDSDARLTPSSYRSKSLYKVVFAMPHSADHDVPTRPHPLLPPVFPLLQI